MKITLTLLERHFCFVASFLAHSTADGAANLYAQIKRIVHPSNLPDEPLHIDTTVDDIARLFAVLGELPDKYASDINGEMKVLLLQQLGANMPATDAVPTDLQAEWMRLAGMLQGISAQNAAVATMQVTEGRRLLLA